MRPSPMLLAISWARCLALLCSSCSRGEAPVEDSVRNVDAMVVATALIPDEVSGFGSLSYVGKVDVTSPHDALLETLLYREGDTIRDGAVVARLRSTQMELSLGQAANGVDQAVAALALADARLFEGRLAAESRILGIENSRLEILQARKELLESGRRHADQETLFLAGGVAEETIRADRFSLEKATEDVALMERELAVRLVGLRDEDLTARGLPVPADTEERDRALATLSTAALIAERDAAAVSLTVARGDLEAARYALSELAVAAVSGGVIGAMYFEAGERVKRGDKLMTIMDVGSLYAIVPVREADALRLTRGMRATVLVDAAGENFEGVVDFVSPLAESRTASVPVRVVIDNPKGRLKPGMFARVTVSVGPRRPFVALPAGAIARRSGNSCSVFAIRDGRVYERRVDIGEASGDGWIVIDGLLEGEVIVDRPDPGLKEGDRVDVSS